jgi:8-oxo-dGTP diphosphatase
VVAGLVLASDRQRFLVTQRMSTDPGYPEHWELPGGKVEPGESDREALARELREELAIEVEVQPTWLRIEQRQEHRLIDFRVLPCTVTAGVPRAVEVQDLRWVTPDEAGELELPPLDRAVLERILSDGLD